MTRTSLSVPNQGGVMGSLDKRNVFGRTLTCRGHPFFRPRPPIAKRHCDELLCGGVALALDLRAYLHTHSPRIGYVLVAGGAIGLLAALASLFG